MWAPQLGVSGVDLANRYKLRHNKQLQRQTVRLKWGAKAFGGSQICGQLPSTLSGDYDTLFPGLFQKIMIGIPWSECEN